MKPGTLLCMVCLCAGTQMVNFVWINLLELVMNCFGRSATGTLDAVSGSSDTVSMFLYASFLAPISEELIFRGFVLRSLRPYGKRFAILGSAFLFGLFHGTCCKRPTRFWWDWCWDMWRWSIPSAGPWRSISSTIWCWQTF